jgi:hypothetical protein
MAMEMGGQFLDEIEQLLRSLTDAALALPPLAALALPWPAVLAIICAPVILAVITRSAISVVGTAFLVALSLAALAQAIGMGPAPALALYAVAILLPLYRNRELRRERAIAALGAELGELRQEIRVFLEALDPPRLPHRFQHRSG